jgi:hypothetical protein
VHERGARHLVDPTRPLEDRAAAIRRGHRSPVWRIPAGSRVATSPYAWPRLPSRGLPARWHRIRRRRRGRADHPRPVGRADDAADPAAGRRRRGRTRVDRAGRGIDARAPADGGRVSHPIQSYGAPWRSAGFHETQQFRTSRHRDDRCATRSDSRRPRAPGRLHVPRLHMHRNVLVSSTPTTEQTRAGLWFRVEGTAGAVCGDSCFAAGPVAIRHGCFDRRPPQSGHDARRPRERRSGHRRPLATDSCFRRTAATSR